MGTNHKIVRRLALKEFKSSPDVSFVRGVHAIRQKLKMRKLKNFIIRDAFQRFKTGQMLGTIENDLVEKFLFNVFVAYLNLKHMTSLTSVFTKIGESQHCASIALNERLLLSSLTYGKTIFIVDTFLGESREFLVENMPTDVKFAFNPGMKLINDKYLLQVFEDTQEVAHLYLLKIDITNSCVEFLDRTRLGNSRSGICLDELDSTRFLVDYDQNHSCVRRIDEDQIILEQNTETELQIHFIKFVGQMIYGFCFHTIQRERNHATVIEVRYSERNLLTREALVFESKSPFKIVCEDSDESFVQGKIRELTEGCRYWSNDKFFLLKQNNDVFFVRVFDTSTLEWNLINVYGCGLALDLFLDNDDVLSIGCICSPSKVGALRFPLRKPDTLDNIVWFNIRRFNFLFKELCYDLDDCALIFYKVKECLPNDSKFQPILPKPKKHIFVELRRGIGLDIYEIKTSKTNTGVSNAYPKVRVIVILKSFLIVVDYTLDEELEKYKKLFRVM